MRQIFRFYLVGFIFMLFAAVVRGEKLIISIQQVSSVKADYSYVSQKESMRKAIYDLFRFYAKTPKEITVTADQGHGFDFKATVRVLSCFSSFITEKNTFRHGRGELNHPLHVDFINYYIFALHKIVI